MVASTALGTSIALIWIGGLALVLVGRAVRVWWTFRQASRSADHSRKLAEATGRRSHPSGATVTLAPVVPLPRRPVPSTPPSDVETEAKG